MRPAQLEAFASPDRELTTAEAARLLGVDASTIRRYPIPFRQYATRGARRYALVDVEGFRAARTVHPVDSSGD